jgi:glycosyltransferase involved in cell wall biosynthesis
MKSVLKPETLLLQQYEPKTLVLPKDNAKVLDKGRQPLVSIVTPSYNQGRFIGKTIDSVLSQNYPHIQYIVQDGASTDETIVVLKRKCGHANFFYESKPDQGQTHAINLGFQKSHGEIMAWLNSDDLLLPGTVSYVINYFNENPNVDAIYGHRVLINDKDQEIGRWVLPPHFDYILNWSDFVPQESLFWRRSLWDQAGGYVDEHYAFAMDWELLTRFIDCGAKIVRVPRFLGAFRVHPQQKSTKDADVLGSHEMDRIRKKIHKRAITEKELFQNTAAYIILSHLFNCGYRMRLLHY